DMVANLEQSEQPNELPHSEDGEHREIISNTLCSLCSLWFKSFIQHDRESRREIPRRGRRLSGRRRLSLSTAHRPIWAGAGPFLSAWCRGRSRTGGRRASAQSRDA